MLPNVGAASCDETTLSPYFQPVHAETYADRCIGPFLSKLGEEHPDLILAVADVDRSQIRAALERAPEERLRACFATAAVYRGMRVVTR